MFLTMETVVAKPNMQEFVTSIIGAVTSEISLTTVATTVGVIIGGGIVAMFAWKFGRKGFAFVKNALSGKGGKI